MTITPGARSWRARLTDAADHLAEMATLPAADAVRQLGELCGPGPAGLAMILRGMRRTAAADVVNDLGSQQDAAAELGISQSVLSRLLNSDKRGHS